MRHTVKIQFHLTNEVDRKTMDEVIKIAEGMINPKVGEFNPPNYQGVTVELPCGITVKNVILITDISSVEWRGDSSVTLIVER